MIISHKYKFIFIKSGKVAGTSLEIALSKFLGPNDIITPVSRPDELVRYHRGYRTAQYFQKSPFELTLTEFPRWFAAQCGILFNHGERKINNNARKPKLFWDHMSASAIRDRIGSPVWNQYYKFTVERNPWDMVISRYYWDPKKRKRGVSFQDFVLSGGPLRSNFDRYTINGIVAVDKIIRYDFLYSELTELSKYLGFQEDIGSTMRSLSAKGKYRPSQSVQSYYDYKLSKIVEVFFAREISLLGFKYDE